MKKLINIELIKLLVLKNQILMNYKDNRFLNEEELVNNLKRFSIFLKTILIFDDADEKFY